MRKLLPILFVGFLAACQTTADIEPPKKQPNPYTEKLTHAGSGCPKTEYWETYIKAIHKMLYADGEFVNISRACPFLEIGTRYRGPLARIEIEGQPISQIELPSGRKYWVESSNL